MYNHIHKRTPLHCNTSLHFTTLHPNTRHYTYRQFTPSRLIIIIPIWTLHRTPRFTPLHCTTLHFTSLHFWILLTHSHYGGISACCLHNRPIRRHNIDCVYTDEHRKTIFVVVNTHRSVPWWLFLREQKHVGASVKILNGFNISTIL